jgi:hypothetical protein
MREDLILGFFRLFRILTDFGVLVPKKKMKKRERERENVKESFCWIQALLPIKWVFPIRT